MADSSEVDDFMAIFDQAVTSLEAALPVQVLPVPAPAAKSEETMPVELQMGRPMPTVVQQFNPALEELLEIPTPLIESAGYSQSGKMIPAGKKPFREIPAELKPAVETHTELLKAQVYPIGYVKLEIAKNWRFPNRLSLFLSEVEALEVWVKSPEFLVFKAEAIKLGLRNKGAAK